MKRISIMNMVDFRRKSDQSKKNFAASLKKPESPSNTEGGGNYWITSLSAIAACYKTNSLEPIAEKKKELEGKLKETHLTITRDMYQRNIDILLKHENLNLKKIRPRDSIFLKRHRDDFVMTIRGLEVQASPNHVFTFSAGNNKEVGTIWFVAKLNGLKKDELGMFCEMSYKYLTKHCPKGHNINSNFCIAMDVVNNVEVQYSQIEKGEVPRILDLTLNELKKLL